LLIIISGNLYTFLIYKDKKLSALKLTRENFI